MSIDTAYSTALAYPKRLSVATLNPAYPSIPLVDDLIDGAVAGTIPAGWVYNGNGTYTADGTQLGELRWASIGLVQNSTYDITFSILAVTTGSLSSKLNGVTQGAAHSTVDTFVDAYTAIDNDGMQILGLSFIGTINTPTVILGGGTINPRAFNNSFSTSFS
jgi:hypothetical protein